MQDWDKDRHVADLCGARFHPVSDRPNWRLNRTTGQALQLQDDPFNLFCSLHANMPARPSEPAAPPTPTHTRCAAASPHSSPARRGAANMPCGGGAASSPPRRATLRVSSHTHLTPASSCRTLSHTIPSTHIPRVCITTTRHTPTKTLVRTRPCHWHQRQVSIAALSPLGSSGLAEPTVSYSPPELPASSPLLCCPRPCCTAHGPPVLPTALTGRRSPARAASRAGPSSRDYPCRTCRTDQPPPPQPPPPPPPARRRAAARRRSRGAAARWRWAAGRQV